MKQFLLRFEKIVTKLLLSLFVLSQVLVFAPEQTQAALGGDNIVISEVQIAGATSDDEFVELYNPTATSITMSGWRLTRKNSSGTEANLVLTLSGTVPSRGYFLIGHGTGYSQSTTTPLDATYSAASNALTNNYTVLLYSDAGSTLVDKVGFGSALDSETSVFASNPTSGQSIERKLGGINGNAQDTDNNSTDFTLRTVSNPQNSLSATTPTAPGIPQNLVATCADMSVLLDWNDVVEASDYAVYVNGVVQATKPTLSVYTVTGLTNGTEYSFQVSARNAFGTEGTLSAITTATPCAPVIVPVTPLSGRGTYSKNSATGILFGQGNVSAAVSSVGGLNVGESPATIRFERPNSPLSETALISSGSGTWQAQNPFVVTQSTGNQDGLVTVTVTTTGLRSFVIDSFSVDTTVAAPTATVTNRCRGAEDSFVAQTEGDVIQVLVYKHSNLESAHLVAYAPVTAGKTTEVYSGDDMFPTLYLVAKDGVGNQSAATAIAFDHSLTAQASACQVVKTVASVRPIVPVRIPVAHAAEKETAVLSAALTVAETKDGAAGEQAKTSEKDKNDEPVATTEVKDRSSLIITIAIILIIAGIAIAAYSWYQGDNEPEEPKVEEMPKKVSAARSTGAKKSRKTNSKNRKTRW